MKRVFGIDLGTNSIGWSIVEQLENGKYRHIKSGVDIFKDGVDHDKSGGHPCVQLRTNARGLRRHYFRRRLHKIELLKILIEERMCPPLTDEDLKRWRFKKIYPKEDNFMEWQRTNDNLDKNPYHDRYVALTRKLDLSIECDRYILGRAFYHLSQRRGFLSNRKDSTKEQEGEVKAAISELSDKIKEAGCSYLCEYFYKLYQAGDKIRGHYTARNEHYLKEFQAICDKQSLGADLCKRLNNAIFYQRPLKSQKGNIGRCTFELGKQRCSTSHPAYEEYRMLCFINNIRLHRQGEDSDFRVLTKEEVDAIIPKFVCKSQFKFEKLAKVLAHKKENYGFKYDSDESTLKFNYRKETSIAGSPVTAGLKEIFGEEWKSEICSVYMKSEGKTEDRIIDDVWHVLYSFDNDENIRDWAKKNMQLDDEQAEKFAKIKIERDYASLSLNAIRKILPYLRRGLRYDEAVFCANIPAALGNVEDVDEYRKIEDDIVACVRNFKSCEVAGRKNTLEKEVAELLEEKYGVDKRHLGKIYHPSKTETYPTAQPDNNGLRLLGSPRTASVRNPMAMRALFRLRALTNELLKKREINSETVVNIEFARGLNDANMRKAIENYQREIADRHQKYAKGIKDCYLKETGKNIEPTENEILKYQLWEEQNHQCLYTGKMISVADFIGANPKFDIEHTLPRAAGGDDSQVNKTLCDSRFNREVKKAHLPSELANHAEILLKAKNLWQKKIYELTKQIEGTKGYAADKNAKDGKIQRRHLLKMKRDYYIGKLQRFEMKEVPTGFSNRQGVDIGIIGKYAKLYLHTVFDKIFVVKGATTAAFRKVWGLQSVYEKKERINHVHHCVDAITIACIGKKQYDDWKCYQEAEDMYYRGETGRPSMDKPWPTFTEDVKQLTEGLLIHHYVPDNAGKASKKKLRVRGRIQRNAEGRALYATGDCARLSLHQQTFYGAIKQDDEIRYVVRKPLDSLEKKDIEKIVDPEVRQKVKEAVDAKGMKDAVADGIWMNEEKRIPIKKVRIYTSIANPLRLKRQRDLSVHDYKRDYYVANDGNYCMGIYEGTDAKGKKKKTFKIVNNMDAANYFKARQRGEDVELLPMSDGNDFPLKCVLKTGSVVLFYQDTPKELKECSKKELAKRLYRVVGMSEMRITRKKGKIDCYGMLSLTFHQEARPSIDLKDKNGEWRIGEDVRPKIKLTHNQTNFLVEGIDFRLTLSGDVEWLK